jgi:predicted nucleic acid-binding protein
MPDKIFLDTNVLVYAVAANDPRRKRAEALLLAGGSLSVQVLNEFVSVARRKMSMPWAEVEEVLDAIMVLCPNPLPITLKIHKSALRIGEKQGYAIYDALVIAAALEADCNILYSEDLQNGQRINGLMIRNPFGPATP